ncbi:MAG TPA: tRNA-dihydrouridine synthase family protein [Spirochaetota bacterium]|nr:tRNA-dihydrouridine synthase family protein [Spirochaetota bacterium]HOS33584.1 tRNA-dihydrouridine synthase family protein [Spirochaetota bacterium]HOS54867.1 tRNA-dihydrouridine synthase family protein [Spirochaetota bacterium]HPK62285.1 tRNA-dihydrouridine synthase family protein [Spirochaetota bacterium]HQF77789.1 tRNA-dihydrouridine synthase family protein [Spirochaetota bacterium]
MNLLHNIQLKNLTLNNNIFLAPLAGYTSYPTRKIYKMQGNFTCYSEMISAEGLNHSFRKSIEIIDTKAHESPVGIQLFGPNADKILSAFLKIRQFYFDIVDINCGCSIKKVLKSNSGAYLLNNPDEIYRIILRLKNETDKPVTIKMRSGYDNCRKNYLQVHEAAVKAGVDMITFHPRTRAMLFSGKADWSLIKEMKKISPVPIIGNGDIFSADDAIRMINETNCDGVMIARGIIENPFLFDEIFAKFNSKAYNSPSASDRVERLLLHCKSLADFYGENRGIREIKKFVKGYLKSLPDISIIRRRLGEVNNFTDFENILKNFLKSL